MKGYVYLLHFEHKLYHSQHYLGWSKDPPDQEGGRVYQHKNGKGSRLTQVLCEKGISFTVVRIWTNVDRNFERMLKNRKNAPRICPLCSKLH